MSNNLREYIPISNDNPQNMYVTAFVGGRYGYSVQFTINGQYCLLAENQVRDLITALQKRVSSVKKYQATQVDLDICVIPRFKEDK